MTERHELVLDLPAGRDVAAVMGRAAMDYLAEPENLAGLAGAFLVPILIFRGSSRVPLIPFIVAGLAGDQACRMAYRLCGDVRDLADAARAGA